MNSLGNIWTSWKNSLIKQSPMVNEVISRGNRMSSVRRSRKKPSELWPNLPQRWPGGKKYFGFVYYPRYPEQQDPEWERSPLFMVTRRKPVKGTPFWLKRILRDFRIEQDNNEAAIVLNCEDVNHRLWKIKHLITITPITFPDGIPEETDIDSCRLYPNGELRFKTTLKVDPARMQATELFQQSIDRIDKESIKKYTRKKWDDGYSLLNEY